MFRRVSPYALPFVCLFASSGNEKKSEPREKSGCLIKLVISSCRYRDRRDVKRAAHDRAAAGGASDLTRSGRGERASKRRRDGERASDARPRWTCEVVSVRQRLLPSSHHLCVCDDDDDDSDDRSVCWFCERTRPCLITSRPAVPPGGGGGTNGARVSRYRVAASDCAVNVEEKVLPGRSRTRSPETRAPSTHGQEAEAHQMEATLVR